MKTLIVHILQYNLPHRDKEEFVELAISSDCKVVDELTITLREINPKTFIGKGQLERIETMIGEQQIERILFDCDINPKQEKWIAEFLSASNPCLKGIDTRSSLIIDVFAKNARTKEAKYQVELLQLEFESGRLVKKWTHLERQRGGTGLRGGPGESQIEIDRRLIRLRISKMKAELKKLRNQRQLNSAKRNSKNIPLVTLVGYTNAGKTSILNKLSDPSAKGENKLFATLDPKSRKLWLPKSMREAVLTDTVGFIADLPHQFVEAFASTLDSVSEAHLLTIILDSSQPNISNHYRTIETILKQIGAYTIPRIIVFNKIDKLNDEQLSDLHLQLDYDEAPTAMELNHNQELEQDSHQLPNDELMPLETEPRTIVKTINVSSLSNINIDLLRLEIDQYLSSIQPKHKKNKPTY